MPKKIDYKNWFIEAKADRQVIKLSETIRKNGLELTEKEKEEYKKYIYEKYLKKWNNQKVNFFQK